MEKPIIIEIDEARRDLVECVNKAANERKIPYFLLEMLLGDVHTRVKENARTEREIANMTYNKKNAEEEAKTEEV